MEEEKRAMEVDIEKARNVPNSIKNGKSKEAEFERNRYRMATKHRQEDARDRDMNQIEFTRS
jgi:hypothetical protein